MVNEQVIPINYGQGVDTKSDPKLVVPGKLLRLENAVFTNPKSIEKRNGYSALSNTIAGFGTLVSPQLTHAYKDELIAADVGQIISYSSASNAWALRGNYPSTELARNTVDQEHPASGFADCAILGSYALYGYSTQTNIGSASASTTQTFATIVDLTTGTKIYGPTSQGTLTSTSKVQPVKCVVLGGTTLALAYLKSDSSAIVLRTFTIAAGVVTVSAELSVTTSFTGNVFDIAATATGAAIAYFTAAGITIATINTAGTVTGTSAFPNFGGFTFGLPVSINVDAANGNIWVYYSGAIYAGPTLTNSNIQYLIVSSTLVTVLTPTLLVTFGAPLFIPSNLSPLKNSTTQQTLYYGYFVSSGSTFSVDVSYSVTATSGGVAGTPTLFANGVAPFSRTFSVTALGHTDQYAVFVYRGFHANDGTAEHQPTFFMIQLNSFSANTGVRQVVARFASGLVNTQGALGTGFNFGIISYQPNVSFITATKTLFAYGANIQEFQAAVLPVIDLQSLSGTFSVSTEFASVNAYRAVNCGDLAVLNGGLVQAYDGQSCTELGFHLFPEISALTASVTGGGGINNGSYSYLAIFQWTDAQGNLHQSAPSIAEPIVVAGADNTVTITVTWNYLSQKQNASVAIYRTNDAGNVYFLATDPVFLQTNTTGAVSVTFIDIKSDNQLSGYPQAYTYPASPVLENSTPPPSMIMLAHNNRLWFVDSENPNTIWYTKSFSPGNGLSPSAFMTQQIDPKYGNISALAEMDDKLVTFKQSGIFVQSGDGVTDTGTGSTLSFPQIVPSDVGCSNLKSVVLTPVGVMFQSPNGVYLLDRSLGVTYKGMEVQADNAFVITSAKLITGKSQIRFLCSTGMTIVYDYIFNQWSNFTNHLGLSSDIWQGSYVYAQSNGSIYKETPGSYLDVSTAYAVLAQTSWLGLASVQGFQRVRRLIVLGNFANGLSANHGVQITASYDFQPTAPGPAVAYLFGAASASGVLQYRERLVQQKCDSVSLLIQEVTTGSALEYLRLTDMSFEAAVKKGLNKLPQTASVG